MMQTIPALPLCYEFSRHLAPRGTVAPGERFLVESEDALSGQIRKPGDQRDRASMPYSNPTCGPIFVEGAKPGDALRITIHDIQPRDGQCATYTGHPGPLTQWLGDQVPPGGHVCPIENGEILWSPTLKIPFQPMLGCVAAAPHWGVPTSLPAGPHGGNMDLVEVCPGSTVILPVTVLGGYLYLGDAHAAMGQGELSATGLEMAALTEVSVEIDKGVHLQGPRIETPNEILAVATQRPMERSVAQAYAQLILWMESDFGWSRWKAYDLLTHVGQVSIGYYDIGTVAAKISRDYLENPE